jgi:hypothetical protein
MSIWLYNMAAEESDEVVSLCSMAFLVRFSVCGTIAAASVGYRA